MIFSVRSTINPVLVEAAYLIVCCSDQQHLQLTMHPLHSDFLFFLAAEL
jgi:hypothetical protein